MSDQSNEIVVVYDKDFLKDTRKLSADVQDKLALHIKILRGHPFDSRLHTKPLDAPLQGMFSFRIRRGYRAGFKFESSHVIRLLAVDRRDKIYKRLKRKI